MNKKQTPEVDFDEIKTKVRKVLNSVGEFNRFLDGKKKLPIRIEIYAEISPLKVVTRSENPKQISPKQAKLWIEVIRLIGFELRSIPVEKMGFWKGTGKKQPPPSGKIK